MFNQFFTNTLSPSAIELPFENTDKSVRNEFKEHLGFSPIVYYNTIQIPDSDLIHLLLEIKENIPQVKMTFYDRLGVLNQRGQPLDNTKLKVFINTRGDLLKTILVEFKIINVKRENGNVFTLKGAIDVDDLYTLNYESFPKSSSLEVLQKVAKQLGLGFRSNVSTTNDNMNWLNYGRKLYQFIKYVVNNSYISDNDFSSYYIDYYYHLNYVNVQKELIRDNSGDEIIVSTWQSEATVTEKKAPIKQKSILSNDKSVSNSQLYISEYTVINNSTSISIQEGYLKTVFYYDNQTKEKLIFELDTLSDSSDKDDLILLKSPGDTQFYKSNFTQEYIGKLDVDNMHKNYNWADFLNNRNLQELEKFTIIATLPNPNFSLYIFQKIQVIFTNRLSEPFAQTTNERLSGNFLITNIKYEWKNRTLVQLLHLSRRDLTITDLEKKPRNS
ncbi:hypothetical protein EBU71_04025 [bacterium]|nr:hypothetical protein [Candidatus Elulimicrobium humile]